jgi:hypothetical protein
MLNPIIGPASPSQGPALGDSTEHDTWSAAVAKINGMFTALYSKLEGPIAHDVSIVDAEAHQLLAELGEHVAALQQRVEALEHAWTSNIHG